MNEDQQDLDEAGEHQQQLEERQQMEERAADKRARFTADEQWWYDQEVAAQQHRHAHDAQLQQLCWALDRLFDRP